jgi:hypothetical protein
MIQAWKLPHMLKGALTYVPALNAWRIRRASTGGSNSARYCYSVWFRHLINLDSCGFKIKGAQVGELGPGDSIGVGLAALLSGAEHYIGLDMLPLSAKADLESIFDELVRLYSRREAIPDNSEFPRVRPQLKSYEFPDHTIEWTGFSERVERIRSEIRKGLEHGRMIRYQAPWTSIADVAPQSLDLIFSQAVLEYVAPLDEAYRAMSVWLKAGRYASHVIDLSSHELSPVWNGHWAYSDREWQLARGRREFFLNREPLETYLKYAAKFGFDIVHLHKDYETNGLPLADLDPHFRGFDPEDLRTRGAILIVRKRSDGQPH